MTSPSGAASIFNAPRGRRHHQRRDRRCGADADDQLLGHHRDGNVWIRNPRRQEAASSPTSRGEPEGRIRRYSAALHDSGDERRRRDARRVPEQRGRNAIGARSDHAAVLDGSRRLFRPGPRHGLRHLVRDLRRRGHLGDRGRGSGHRHELARPRNRGLLAGRLARGRRRRVHRLQQRIGNNPKIFDSYPSDAAGDVPANGMLGPNAWTVAGNSNSAAGATTTAIALCTTDGTVSTEVETATNDDDHAQGSGAVAGGSSRCPRRRPARRARPFSAAAAMSPAARTATPAPAPESRACT